MSWWSPAPSSSPLASKGRSFDLNSGEIESTEETYVNRMQIKKQTSYSSIHDDLTSDVESASGDIRSNY